MEKRRIYKNCSAISAPLEFTIAFGIFLIGLTLLITMANTMFAPYDLPDPDLRAKAIEISDVIIGNPGCPVGWGLTTDWEDNTITRFGLAYHDGDKASYGLIDKDKLNVLDTHFAIDPDVEYIKMKNLLGFDTTSTMYDFAFIIDEDGEDPVTYGKSYENANLVKAFTRKVTLFGAGDASLTVIVFR